MSVDDLFVLNRFLPSAGELLHYLEVRQAAGGIKRAVIFDEIEHLGAYIRDNRFDMSIREQLKEADMVLWDSFGDVVDKYFEGRAWETEAPPRQDYPEELEKILAALNKYRPAGWLAVDAFIRNQGGPGRKDLADLTAELKSTLARFASRRFLYGGDEPFQVWTCRVGSEPSPAIIQYQGQVASLFSKGVTVSVLILSYNPKFEIVGMQCTTVGPPSVLQVNYPELLEETEKQRGRLTRRPQA
jgi:hypothetical protein